MSREREPGNRFDVFRVDHAHARCRVHLSTGQHHCGICIDILRLRSEDFWLLHHFKNCSEINTMRFLILVVSSDERSRERHAQCTLRFYFFKVVTALKCFEENLGTQLGDPWWLAVVEPIFLGGDPNKRKKLHWIVNVFWDDGLNF